MENKNKNPMLVGLLNVLIPGSSYWFMEHDRGRFIKTLIGGVATIAVLVVLGNTIQHTRGYTLPSGICTGSLVLVAVLFLFITGQRTALVHNRAADSNTFFNSKRTPSHQSAAMKYSQIQKLRDEGLISDQEYAEKNARVAAKKP
jgi:uncharacterized membrane protein